jgi:hypothetical protein
MNFKIIVLEFGVAVRTKVEGARSSTNTDETFRGQTCDRDREYQTTITCRFISYIVNLNVCHFNLRLKD